MMLLWSLVSLLSLFLRAYSADCPVEPTLLLKPQSCGPRHALTETMPQGKPSYYSARLEKLIRQWPPAELPKGKAPDIWVRAIRTPGHPNYIGVLKCNRIEAPLEAVREVVENLEGYLVLYPEMRKALVSARNGNWITVSFERAAPLFFVPAAVYDMIYVVENKPQRHSYRYQLKSGNLVNFSDGFVVLEPLSPKSTRIVGYDFFETDWGILRTLAESKIWEESLRGSYVADIAFKLRAENPSWDAAKLKEQTKKYLDANPMGAVEFIQPKALE